MAFLSFSNHPASMTWLRVTFGCSPSKNCDETKRFEDIGAIKKNATSTLNTIPKDSFKKCFQQWQDRWQHCISSQGEYFENY
jgi:hypothetical protein